MTTLSIEQQSFATVAVHDGNITAANWSRSYFASSFDENVLEAAKQVVKQASPEELDAIRRRNLQGLTYYLILTKVQNRLISRTIVSDSDAVAHLILSMWKVVVL